MEEHIAGEAPQEGEPGGATTAPLHMYEVEEGCCVTHWVAASSAEEALAVVRNTACVEDGGELTVVEVGDETLWPVTYVDGFDDGERWEEEIPPGAQVTFSRDRIPTVTAKAGEWARWHGRSCYTGCSEY